MSEPVEARLQLAGHWLQMGRPERALDELQGLWGEAAADYRAYLFRGAALHALDRNVEAADVLREGLAQHGPFLPMLHILGSSLRAEGLLSEAEAAYLQGLSLDPDEPDLLIGYAQVCLTAGQIEKADALVERAAAHAPDSQAVAIARAQVAYTRGQARPEHGDAQLMNHPLMRPLRPFQRFNPLVVWIGAVAIIYGLRLAGLGPLAFVVAIGWFGFCIYSWVAPPLLRRWLNRSWGQ